MCMLHFYCDDYDDVDVCTLNHNNSTQHDRILWWRIIFRSSRRGNTYNTVRTPWGRGRREDRFSNRRRLFTIVVLWRHSRNFCVTLPWTCRTFAKKGGALLPEATIAGRHYDSCRWSRYERGTYGEGRGAIRRLFWPTA